MVVTLSGKKFFGFVKEKADKNEFFNISSREKTIVDGLMHPQYCGGMVEVAKATWNAKKEVSWQKVLDMAEKVEINAVLKRLGYVLSILDLEEDTLAKIDKKTHKKSSAG